VDGGEGFGGEGNVVAMQRWQCNDRVGLTKRGRRKLPSVGQVISIT